MTPKIPRGWRRLRLGYTIKKGDRFLFEGKWFDADEVVGSVCNNYPGILIRRSTPAKAKQSEIETGKVQKINGWVGATENFEPYGLFATKLSTATHKLRKATLIIYEPITEAPSKARGRR